MIVFPAIDLKEGRCVRLMQGRMDKATVYGTDPVEVALRWQDQGAPWLHVVDLDGAFARSPKNREVVAAIVQAVKIPVQLGGGIRSVETAAVYLDLGVRRVILGTAATRNPKMVEETCRRFPGRVALGIDARNGRVAVEGWTETTDLRAVDFARGFETLPLAAIIYTDIHRDGMQSGVNLEATAELCRSVSTPVIASGGVSGWEDIEALLPLVPMGLEGVIVGRALYTGALDLAEALRRIKDMAP
ncbi:1-(5-phosphoribosyl)-5-[(5-phosphoribosylamino)methylideneamino] imidazole-4-carboxamide isomerase [Desulfacinum hydrothermale DSM 13146]|uniref:1-(5-phosphoribosyl)-5-[(5-phosphoribosylamino)methylideneamino] imidazole-4-carboxamide isomerase n=1 Tax=Desulfacinum hydrothermale DSM 13146 TaxID=1121390 RepID=A0A1W1XJ49_9BACT|nr:1-(5-phosphoribosyl)-5-[(5-phosphoribosylamino)methylideneamino]imidazole-4-carboxamide isomerase [Desulfacinum hydrothermale]SMC24003.1 1-(5-phosphoribosyl)-5-[(5-phosphoribosylamino)methylideneamino] imidazole-4-carboxamide isomerase [Desulfacinum hydrothermale DSM 13146]